METGIQKLDELLGGGIPKGKNLIYFTQPGVEEEVFSIQTIYTTLSNGGTIVIIGSSNTPTNIKNQIGEFGWDINSFKDNLIFIDAYSPLIAVLSKKTHFSNPDYIKNFNEKIINLLKNSPPSTIIFESLSTIMDSCGEKETIEAIKTWNKIAGQYEHIIVYNFTAWAAYSQDTLNLIKKDLFNAVVSIGIMAESAKFGKYFEISKSDWIKKTNMSTLFFRVLRPGGIKLSKILITGPFDHEPKIIYKHIASTKRKCVRFCLVQLDFSLDSLKHPGEFGYVLNEKEEIKYKIIEALRLAEKNDVNIICFPELSFTKDWVEEIRNQFKDMVIIGGSYYDKGYNICPIIINGMCIDPPYKKHRPSPSETPGPTGRGMKSGNNIYIYQTKFGRFSVLTCIDYKDQSYPICRYKHKGVRGVDFVINPCYEQNIRRVQYRCNADCEDYGISIIQVNRASDGKKYGGTCIIGKEHEVILDRLKDEGFKPKDDIKYKLCESNGEMIIVADLNIEMKAPPVDLPIDYAGRIRILKKYKYEQKNWLLIQ